MKLQWTNTVTVDQTECHRRLGKYWGKYVHANTICTSNARGVGACTGDDGSSLINRGTPRALIGIFTYAPRDCADGSPDIYSRVYPNLQFIRGVMKRVE